jgi:autophagy-related protein 17
MQVEFLRVSGGQLEGALDNEEGLENQDDGAGAKVPMAEDPSQGEVIPALPKDVIEQAYARVRSKERDLVQG